MQSYQGCAAGLYRALTQSPSALPYLTSLKVIVDDIPKLPSLRISYDGRSSDVQISLSKFYGKICLPLLSVIRELNCLKVLGPSTGSIGVGNINFFEQHFSSGLTALRSSTTVFDPTEEFDDQVEQFDS
ncbi:hypothetical protein AcV5_003212 [Taiwanofungus camphoratus]|nr:hypothetical protein AcV5_003212 [Antrodia cinnamomea]